MHTVDEHFTGRGPVVREIYDRILAASRKWGPVEEDPKKTSIHLNRSSAFAGIQTGKDHLVLTVKSRADILSPGVRKREQVSANRWYCYIKLTSADELD